MSQNENIQILEQDIEAINSKMLEAYGKSESDLESYTDTLLEWLKTQPHLPETDNRYLVRKFLLLTKFSVERCKQKLDMYYTIRNRVPEMFFNPNSPSMIEQRRVIPIVALPRLTCPSLSRVVVFRLSADSPSSKLNSEEMYSIFFAIMEVLIKEDRSFQLDVVVDQVNVRLEHLPMMDIISMKKSQTVLEKVFSNRIRQIHLVNVHQYLSSFIALIKKALSDKLRDRFHVHTKSDALLDFYSKEILPQELGGTGPSIDTLTKLWDKKFLEYKDRFEKLQTLKVDESLRPQPLENDDILGWHGNFKKLNVD